MGLLGILVGLVLLMALAYRGWSILLLAPLAALIAAAFSAEPLLAHWTQTFMGAAAGFVAQFFPLFLLGALFGKLMDDSGSVNAIADYMTYKLGPERAVLAVILAGALVTYGGVSLFVAFFVIAPMGLALFRASNVPRRLLPAAIALGTSTFTMSALPGTPAIQNAIPMPFFGTTAFAAPGLGVIAAAIMFGFGFWWLRLRQGRAEAAGEGFGSDTAADTQEGKSNIVQDVTLRELATTAREFDPIEVQAGKKADTTPGIVFAVLPLGVVVLVNLVASQFVLPRMDFAFLALPEWGSTSLGAIGGVWAVALALLAGIIVLLATSFSRLPSLRESVDAGCNASVLPIMSVASLVGFGAVVAALPAFSVVKEWVLGIEGGPLVSLAVATNILAALTGSASGGMTIALDALGPTFMQISAQTGLDPAIMHRVAVISSGTLDSLPHNGAVVTMLAVCGCSHKESYADIVVVAVLGAMLALVAVILLGSLLGSF
ncbi:MULTISPECIES: GntP family permease [Pseudovibrio]|uniref:GntP family permease n=1 Tax=Stappiaceae TaxID=2821832 RepID=UPI0023657269|nr:MULTISPECIES: GntP family permease [Pseudovibrio]MDD7911989.1 GntP family permease [Pseudovibrio exalbescens]MDX5595482.1 GntP family permease [Pseudovibrio sp. SPO723]